MTDLNTLISAGSPLYLLEAFGINDRGQIAGFGSLSNGDLRAYLLTPCDENHGDGEGCEEGGGESAMVQTNSIRHETPSGTRLQSLVRRMGRYRFPGAFGPRN
jgi:hypothetical protein